MADIIAVFRALVAFAALRSDRVAREAAARQEWWDRAKWALDLARSSTRVERTIGLRALDGMLDSATEGEARLILAVQNAVVPPKGSGQIDVNSNGATAETRWRKLKHG